MCRISKTSSALPLPPSPVALPLTKADTDDELALAIQLSLQESQDRDRKASVAESFHEADEEAMMATAIAASLQESHPTSRYSHSFQQTQPDQPTQPTRPTASQPELLSSIERETVHLFSELMARLSLTGQKANDPELSNLAHEMTLLRDRLKRSMESGEVIATSGIDSFLVLHCMFEIIDFTRLVLTLDESLGKFSQLTAPAATHYPSTPSAANYAVPSAPVYNPYYPASYPYYPGPPPATSAPTTPPSQPKEEKDDKPLIEL